MARPHYLDALQQAGVLERLRDFDPHVAGTPPLGIDLPESDIDVLCHAQDAEAFAARVWQAFADLDHFALRQWRGPARAVIAGFPAHGWAFEIFGAAVPVCEQAGWRHFVVERRLLALGGEAFRESVMARRRQGAKTEPAFAAILGLAGNPYRALLDLEAGCDAALAEMLAKAGFPGP